MEYFVLVEFEPGGHIDGVQLLLEEESYVWDKPGTVVSMHAITTGQPPAEGEMTLVVFARPGTTITRTAAAPLYTGNIRLTDDDVDYAAFSASRDGFAGQPAVYEWFD